MSMKKFFKPISNSRTPYHINVYNWRRDTSPKDVLLRDVFDWGDQFGKASKLLAIWPPRKDSLGIQLDVEDADAEAGEKAFIDAEDERRKNNPDTAVPASPTIPFRLYDCSDGILKDHNVYLKETDNVVPPYLVVSQVWGDIKEQLSIPSIEWGVPISNSTKWDVILEYCKREQIRWLWMDILCINQTRDSLIADQEKAKEIPKMTSYYREATACLVIPERYEAFDKAYRQVMEVYSAFGGATSGTLITDNALAIWSSMEMMNTVITDAWFSRIWTYQEYLLPKQHFLLDGQRLDVNGIRLIIDWYHKILRNKSLQKPAEGKDYSFVAPNTELVIRGWTPEHMGYDLKEELDHKGHLDLGRVVQQTLLKKCTKDEDRLFALYGLISEDEKVAVEVSSGSPSAHNISVSGESPDKATLRMKWMQTMVKVLAAGRIWPLLYNALDPDDITPGFHWMPRITTPSNHARGVWSGPIYLDTIHHKNRHTIQFADDGLHIAVRRVGRIIGASTNMGDGGGELNKAIASIWLLMAKGFNIDPVVEQFKYGLSHADRDAVPRDEVAGAQMLLEAALRAESLGECFYIFEQAQLRSKLVYGDGVSGWHRQIVCMVVEGQHRPLVFMAWIHNTKKPERGKCWVFDVTSEPLGSVKRWVVANRHGPNTYTKIGTVYACPASVDVEDSFIRVILD
ncbi:heterokaryon incompatibility protein-domain-containing protein [Hygrophoropsis aurantiaca]|uniref:Heterokaryon incompatibility protein-domain-containing protein n=1 Tax=Hygrophoropsis aurantiaca TaxID=72124 RepID=A0ACB7ZWV4_9AGAM|nr:heterokaryon incompatibility protein-domain-containing protein [Hygrophoropsis aurantiaca]